MTPMVIVAFALFEVGLIIGASGWGYEGENGPKHWAKTYPECGGKRQSPIAITDRTDTREGHLTWSGYDEYPDSMTLTNNGHSVALTSEGVTPTITTSAGKSYQLDNVHFHWGKKNSEGSEHTLGHRRYAMEMHAVHARVKTGSGPAESDFLVTAVFFEASLFTHNDGINNFIDDMHRVTKANTSTPVDPFPWNELLQEFNEDLFFYEGSLTTPPCSEIVTFYIKRQHERISTKQLERFRKLLNDEGRSMSGNFRPLQKRNGRNIYFFDE